MGKDERGGWIEYLRKGLRQTILTAKARRTQSLVFDLFSFEGKENK